MQGQLDLHATECTTLGRGHLHVMMLGRTIAIVPSALHAPLLV